MVRAFALGAFDCTAVPFTTTELPTWVHVVLRKSPVVNQPELSVPYCRGDLDIDCATCKVYVSEKLIHPSPTEYKILTVLCIAGGRPLTHRQLFIRRWGALSAVYTGIVRTCIKYLRRKLGDDAEHPRYIFNEYGVGYRKNETANNLAPSFWYSRKEVHNAQYSQNIAIDL